MTVTVLKAGTLTTVQDAGRHGFRHLGVGSAGALDAYSSRVANLLVGNDANVALLEMTLTGPTLRFEHAARIAYTGAEIDASANGMALPGWRPIDLPAGTELRFAACRRGVRAYLAVAGGFDVPRVLGSASTDLRAGFGGCEGRALRAGEVLRLGGVVVEVDALRIASWWIAPQPDFDPAHETLVHLMSGRDATSPADAITTQAWRVATASDRQGLRLEGPPLTLADARDRISEPVTPGTVQLPPDGQPIVLLADAQTIGGYPRIGHVASADLPRLAHCRPGDVLHFTMIDAVEAQSRWRAQQQRLTRIELAIAQRGLKQAE